VTSFLIAEEKWFSVQRCFYPIIETFTEERIRRGLMADNVIQRCIDTHTCVAVFARRHAVSHVAFSRTELFADGYKLRVAGVLLHSSTDGNHFDFEIVISGLVQNHRARR